jgi:endonuclease YncB( thermonuclease family)
VRGVAYVVDGDTIRLKSGRYVRLIGIDTPEVGQCGYQKAKRQLNKCDRAGHPRGAGARVLSYAPF